MPVRILLADDQPRARELLCQELEDAGYRVETAGDGEEAWAAFQRLEFDLVVTDRQMPRCDGIELTTRIRSQESRNPAVAVILQTSYADPATVQRAKEAGATEIVLLRDVGIEGLLERILALKPPR